MLAPLAAALAGTLATALAAAAYGDPVVALTLTDPRISESSGLAASSTVDGVLLTHNDSGDSARFFAVDASGRTVTTYDLPDVQARDWEAIAVGPDERGRSSVWLGDIGDNSARRDNGVLVHRLAEPVPDQRERVTTAAPTDFRLRYPDGPGDAEGLVVHPTTGRLYLVSKPLAGPAKVYAAPQPLDPDGPNVLQLVGQVEVRSTGTPGGPGIGGLAQLLVTDAAISPDGTRFAVRTYTDVYEYDLAGDDLGAALRQDPVVSPLPATVQGEGLTYSRDSRSLLTSTEGRGTPVHRVVPVAAPAAPPSPSGQAVPPPALVPGVQVDVGNVVLAAGLALATVVGLLLLSGRRRRRARR